MAKRTKRTLSVHVEATGAVRYIYSDDLRFLQDLGEARINRASHVEPTVDGKWVADMSPVGGPALGPFESRSQALEEEVAWLDLHM